MLFPRCPIMSFFWCGLRIVRSINVQLLPQLRCPLSTALAELLSEQVFFCFWNFSLPAIHSSSLFVCNLAAISTAPLLALVAPCLNLRLHFLHLPDFFTLWFSASKTFPDNHSRVGHRNMVQTSLSPKLLYQASIPSSVFSQACLMLLWTLLGVVLCLMQS